MKLNILLNNDYSLPLDWDINWIFLLFRLESILGPLVTIGMAMGRGGAKRWGLCPRLYGFVLPHPHPVPNDGENFLTPSPPLGASRSPASPVKLYFLLICPTTSIIFLMKPISMIKIYLKLQLNLSNQIKSIFRKNCIIYPSV